MNKSTKITKTGKNTNNKEEIKDKVKEDNIKVKNKASKSSKVKKIKTPSGYILFTKEERQNVKKENPEAAPKEILSLLGKKWKGLSDNEKKKYNDLAQELKEKALNEIKEDKKSNSNNNNNNNNKSDIDSDSDDGNIKSRKKKPGKPKAAKDVKQQKKSNNNNNKNKPITKNNYESDDDDDDDDDE